MDRLSGRDAKGHNSAFTLAEVVICIAIVAMVFGTIILAYTQAAKRAQWSGYSLAAQALALQSIEQARSAVWDPSWTDPATGQPKNEIANLVGITSTKLDLPMSGTNFVMATNYVTLPYTNSLIQMIRVETVWPFRWGSTTKYYTNTICTFCAADNRDNSTF